MIECYQACGELYNKRKSPSCGWQHKPGKTMVQSFFIMWPKGYNLDKAPRVKIAPDCQIRYKKTNSETGTL